MLQLTPIVHIQIQASTQPHIMFSSNTNRHHNLYIAMSLLRRSITGEHRDRIIIHKVSSHTDSRVSHTTIMCLRRSPFSCAAVLFFSCGDQSQSWNLRSQSEGV